MELGANLSGFGWMLWRIMVDLGMDLGGFEEIIVERVLGYTYVGSSGAYEQVDFEDAKTFS